LCRTSYFGRFPLSYHHARLERARPCSFASVTLDRDIDQIPSASSFLKTEQSQVAQPFLTREVLQALDHLRGPRLDSFQEIPTFFLYRGAPNRAQYSG